MAYFNHAFQKVFYAGSPAGGGATGYINNAGDSSVDLLPTYGVGAVTFADQSQAGWPSVVAASAPVVAGQPLTLLATSLYQNDKVGPFHGGYQETTKSKMINPKFISKFYRVDSAAAANHIIGIGATPNLDLTGADAACCPEFYCNESYGIRLDLKGSPALRMLNHNAYEVACAWTGCCDGPTPELVDPFDVMSTWAKYIHDDPKLSGAYYGPGFQQLFNQRLVNVGVTSTCDDGTTWDLYLPDNAQVGVAGLYFQADGTTPTAAATAFVADVEAATGVTFNSVAPISSYVSTFDPQAPNCCSGVVVEAAFVETKFGDCTFEASDKFELEPLLIQASMVDETGDPCVFEQLCISDGITPSGAGSQTVYPAIQFGSQAMGTGERVLRDLILSEGYSQNHFSSHRDKRYREITQGFDVTNAVNRNGLYTSYYILHSVPRFNNPSGVFDNDQYLLRVVMDAPDANFEAFMAAWLAAANNPITLETY